MKEKNYVISNFIVCYLFRKISENGLEGQRVAYDGAEKRPADGWRTTDESRRHGNDVNH